jgi:hypothetical protein
VKSFRRELLELIFNPGDCLRRIQPVDEQRIGCAGTIDTSIRGAIA